MDVPDPGWGFLEWAAGGLGSLLGLIATLLWRIGTKVGSVLKRVDVLEDRVEKTESQVAKQAESNQSIAVAVAALPNQISERFDRRFDDMAARIDRLKDK